MEFSAPLEYGPDATELIAYLQASAEKARAGLSRALHDELGGLLVAATMDVGFVEQALGKDERTRHQLSRARAALAAAIDLKRRLVEDLRPSMLDNFGLFEAIKWAIKLESDRSGLPCTAALPAAEPGFSGDAAIALFRMVQDALGVALRQSLVKAAHVALEIDGDALRLVVWQEGGVPDQALAPEDVLVIYSLAYRAHSFGGRMAVTAIKGGGARYTATLPQARLVPT